ncbi:MAG: HAD family phosphatase [Lachnospiraceae bacterium]|nr:HAD family phosphatase [Lachnospiraceae bacterium]
MRIGCAIFDFDGTLFDSMGIWEDVGDRYLISKGKIPKPTLREDLRALSLYQAAVFIRNEYDLDISPEKIMGEVNKVIEKYYLEEVLPKPGVIEFLEKMKRKNIPMCIATASDRYHIESALKRCNLLCYFEKIFTCDENGHGKDEPDIFIEAADFFGVPYGRAFVFEDAIHAASTAKQAGFFVVSVKDVSEMRQEKLKEV